MFKRGLVIASVGACVSTALVLAGVASPAATKQAAAPPAASCANPIQIGMMGPFTGPVASIGDDQTRLRLRHRIPPYGVAQHGVAADAFAVRGGRGGGGTRRFLGSFESGVQQRDVHVHRGLRRQIPPENTRHS